MMHALKLLTQERRPGGWQLYVQSLLNRKEQSYSVDGMRIQNIRRPKIRIRETMQKLLDLKLYWDICF